MSQPSLHEGDAAFAPIQGSLFHGDKIDGGESRSYLPDSADIRRRLNAVLDKARCAQQMPWNVRDARMWQTVFPQMANWLPEGDAKQLCFEFAREIERLQLAA